MAAVSFQLAAVFQETITETPGAQTTGNATPVNPNQAQGAPAPQDTVTLTGQAPQGQQTQQNAQQQPPFQETVLVVAEAQVQVFAPGDNGAANTGAQQTPEAPPTAQVQTQTQLQDPAAALWLQEMPRTPETPEVRGKHPSRNCNSSIRRSNNWESIRRASVYSTGWHCCSTPTTPPRCNSSSSNCSKALRK